ncbi:MAG: polyketide synthase, partial [Acidobacteria bacterium]|nr:polyketide synthase [Acidobacteriota bacterium]
AAQPAIFVTELALAELLRGWGIEPEAMIGHSIGEFTAACISGVLSLEDALEVVATRARLIQSRVPPGAMLAVPLTEEELTPLLAGGVSLAAVNAYRLCIASGEEEAVVELAARLTGRGISSQRLRSTHAYHSQMMEALVEPLTEVLRRVKLHPPRIPYVSCITGSWIRDEEATDAQYWARHLCRTVRFQQGLSTLFEEPSRILVEVGPGQGLTAHAIAERSRIPGRENAVIPTMRWSYGLQAETAVLLRGIGQLWVAGGALDTSRFLARERPQRVSLPTYPFERQRYWIDPPADGGSATSIVSGRKKPDVADWFYLPSWKPSVRPHVSADEEVTGNWLLFVDASGAGADLARDLRGRGANVVTVQAGSAFKAEDDAFVIDPRDAGDYNSLLGELRTAGWTPGTIVHLWMLTANDETPPSAERFARFQELGFHSVMRLIQALCKEGLEGSVKLHLVANHLHEVSGDEPIIPEKATVRAPAMVAPQEHPGLACRTIDTDIAPDDAGRRDALVAQLLGELLGEATEPLVAYRRKQRWLPAYEPVRLEAVPERRLPFRRNGVYLLTGGLGGVGMVLARHLAERVAARLVLIGRTPFPDRAEWDGWQAEHTTGDSTSRSIEQIRKLETLGAEVLVLRADVASREEMEQAFAAVTERFGELHGVIHAAGAVGLETFREIRQASTVDSEKQFVAKVQGLMVLGELLADQPLDFCLLMSSLSAILGGLGFAAYTAANLFMDAFARWKNRGDGTRWTSVDWDSWRLADMRPVIAGLGATVSEFVMEPDEGASACERILAVGDLGQVVVSSGDLQGRLRLWIDRRGAAVATQSPTVRHERPNMRTAYEAPRGQLERELAEIWQELFGVAAVGIHDNFFELGGHSLLATQLNARLSSKLHVEMSLATLLQVPTIADLAVAVVSHQAESADPEALEAMLAELGDLSSEEMQDLLAGGGDE